MHSIFSFNLTDLHTHIIMRLQQEPITSLACPRAALLTKAASQHKASNSCRIILPALGTWGGDPGHCQPQSTPLSLRCPEEHRDGVTGCKQAVLTPCKHTGHSPPHAGLSGRHTDEVRNTRGATTSVPSRSRPAAAAGLAGAQQPLGGRGLPAPLLPPPRPHSLPCRVPGRGGTRACPAPPLPVPARAAPPADPRGGAGSSSLRAPAGHGRSPRTRGCSSARHRPLGPARAGIPTAQNRRPSGARGQHRRHC